VLAAAVEPFALSALKYGLFALLVLFLLALWQGLYWLGGETALSSPRETVVKLGALLGSAWFWPHVRESGAALLIALLIASAGGVALGLALGLNRFAGTMLEPILVSLYSLPKITLYPLILLLFGLGMPAKIVFGAIHGIIPVTLFTLNSVRNLKPVLLRTARVFRLGLGATVWRVAIPAALPEIVSGLRLGFSLTLLGVLLGEMFASQRGLGFLVMNAIGLNDVPTMMAVTLLLAVFAVTVSVLLLNLDRRLHRRATG